VVLPLRRERSEIRSAPAATLSAPKRMKPGSEVRSKPEPGSYRGFLAHRGRPAPSVGVLPRFAAFPSSAARPAFRVDGPLYQLLQVRWRHRHGPSSRDRRSAVNSGTGEVSVTWALSRRTPARQRWARSARRLGDSLPGQPAPVNCIPRTRVSLRETVGKCRFHSTRAGRSPQLAATANPRAAK
jgi:hypothetical protein